MSAPGKIKRILVICGICFKESCPYSRWIDVPEDDGLDEVLGDFMDDYFADLQSMIDREKGLLVKAIQDVMPNAQINESDLERLLAREHSNEPETERERIKTVDDGFLASILNQQSLPADTIVVRNMQSH